MRKNEGLERILEITPAFDRRDEDPNKNYGIHCVDLRVIVKGRHGSIQFVLYTNWNLPHVQKELEQRREGHLFCHPMPADIGYHSTKPMYPGQKKSQVGCRYVPDGESCYYDGSSLRAKEFYDLMIKEGGEALWKKLEAEYAANFTETVAPTP